MHLNITSSAASALIFSIKNTEITSLSVNLTNYEITFTGSVVIATLALTGQTVDTTLAWLQIYFKFINKNGLPAKSYIFCDNFGGGR